MGTQGSARVEAEIENWILKNYTYFSKNVFQNPKNYMIVKFLVLEEYFHLNFWIIIKLIQYLKYDS